MRPTAFFALTEAWTSFWSARDARERKLLLLMTASVLLAVIYLLLINPALTGRAQLQKRLPVLRQQAAELHVLARQAVELRNSQNAASTEAPTEDSVGSAMVRSGLKPQSVMQTGNAVKVQLTSAPFSGIISWLNDMQQSAGLVVADAQIEVLPTVDTANGTITLRQPANQDSEN